MTTRKTRNVLSLDKYFRLTNWIDKYHVLHETDNLFCELKQGRLRVGQFVANKAACVRPPRQGR